MRRVEQAQPAGLRWPHLEPVPRSPIRAAVARWLFLRGVRGLPLSVRLPDGGLHGAGGPVLDVTDPDTFFARIGRDGALGFGESYLLGAWDIAGRDAVNRSDQLVDWLRIYATALMRRESTVRHLLRQAWHTPLPVSEPNTAEGALRNVQAHYDLDDRLFELLLDPSMAYSSAWFEPGDDLHRAQLRKMDGILDFAGVGPASRVLDVGSGFGGLALRAAGERSAAVTGITLSQRQLDVARRRAEDEGLSGRASFRLEDYREHQGSYDAVVSVEMIEAVGRSYWEEFFRTINRLLTPDGRFALQVIVFPHRRMVAAANDFSWVDRYIFPGGALLSLREIRRILRTSTSLEIVQTRRLSDSYAQTLRQWRHTLLALAEDVTALGFDQTFVRLWTLYFAYFESGFRSRYCDVWQLAMRKR